jgi:peptidoglycan hydrolase-like protein with peptidoglycan-binding domain
MARDGLVRALRAGTLIAALAVLTAPASAQAAYAQRTLATGSHGGDVKLLQRYLTKAGFTTTADGQYGRQTATAQRRFERSQSRTVDGRASRGEQRLVKREATAAGTASPQPEPQTQTQAQPHGKAVIGSDGRTAIAPDDAPPEVKAAIDAANRITDKPYKYGGGHGRWEDSGYDCSGSVSYALHGGGLLDEPLDSSAFARWGEAGRGEWITVYANSGHAYAVIAGLRFDTSSGGSNSGSGPRWRETQRSASGYTARHPAGF